MQQKDRLAIETLDGVRVIRFSRPERKNALDSESYRQLVAALNAAAEEDSVSVLILSGSQDCFCGGNDLDDFIENPITDDRHPVYHFMYALHQFEKPVIAAVEGPAIGIGCTLLLHCDLIYAGQGARLQMPFVRLGLCPEFASTLLLPGLLGHQLASEVLLLGKPLDAQRALSYRLVNDVVPAGAALDAAMDSARQLAGSPANAVRNTKRLLRAGQADAFNQAMRDELAVLVESLTSEAFNTAVEGYRNRQKR